MIKTQVQIKEYVHQILNKIHFGVLATESDSQPHACFIAITTNDDVSQLYFATYRNTRKYLNLIQNENVCILFEYKNEKKDNQQEISILTAFGKAKELNRVHSNAIINAHLLQHPEFKTFLESSDCAFFQVTVDAYQLVLGVDEIYWWKDILYSTK